MTAANKTGELADVENDAAIVFTDQGDCILTVQSETLRMQGQSEASSPRSPRRSASTSHRRPEPRFRRKGSKKQAAASMRMPPACFPDSDRFVYALGPPSFLSRLSLEKADLFREVLLLYVPEGMHLRLDLSGGKDAQGNAGVLGVCVIGRQQLPGGGDHLRTICRIA